MKLDNGTSHERKLSLPYPLRDHKVFLKLLLLDAEMHPPQAAVAAISISCEPTKPRVFQNGLFIPLAPEPEKLELTLARLTKLVGPENIGSPELVDTHRPDAFRLRRFALANGTNARQRRKKTELRQLANGDRQCLLAFRVFRPPLRAIVVAVQGCPKQINAWGANHCVYGKVVCAAGPWRTTGNWWCSDSWTRDEWDVAVESRAGSADGNKVSTRQELYRLYRELSNGTWFVEGVYD
jgi:protein ImuB